LQAKGIEKEFPLFQNLNYQINSKLNYLEHKIREREIENFSHVWLELCRYVQRYLDNIWQVLQFDATLGARAFLQRTDIIGEFTEDVLTIWPCRSINVSRIYSDYKINNTCYKYLPVKIDNVTMFASPGGIDLVEYSPNCKLHVRNCRHFQEE
jgi:hypothetical protein